MNILNPFGFVFLDVLYYMLVLGLGPLLFWYLLIFRPRQNKLHDAYLHTGVETLGIVTHRKIIITRGSITRIERSRTFHIRYAYKAPGMDTIYVKDFVQVKQNQLQQRLIRVVVLPGQPESGVPQFLVSRDRAGPVQICLCYILSLAVVAYGIYLFQLLYASQIMGHCIKQERIVYCGIRFSDTALAFITVMAVGLFGAWMIYRAERARVPGRVWNSLECRSESTTATTTARMDNTLDDRVIPMAQVMAVLNDDDNESTRTQEQATTSEVAMAYPVEGHPEDDSAKMDAPIPEAKTLEMV